MDIPSCDGTRAILGFTSVELVFRDTDEHATLCIISAGSRAHFVVACGESIEVLPSNIFLGTLFQDTCLEACTVVVVGPPDPAESSSGLRLAFASNVTAVCTSSGALLVLERGCALYRYQMPFQDASSLLCNSCHGSVEHLLVWSKTSGVVVLRPDNSSQIKVKCRDLTVSNLIPPAVYTQALYSHLWLWSLWQLLLCM